MTIFTAEEVVNLNDYQQAGQYHPFTCPNRDNPTQPHPLMNGDNGVLVPTIRGWICPFCDYTQGWAHGFMKEKQA
jgi:hypothetical protein